MTYITDSGHVAWRRDKGRRPVAGDPTKFVMDVRSELGSIALATPHIDNIYNMYMRDQLQHLSV
jgi:hypothetical protein